MRTDGTFRVGASGTTLNVPAGGNFSYRTNVLAANTNGKVGIGTNNPSEALEVASGHISMSYGDPYLKTNADNKYIVLSGGSGWTPTGRVIVLRGSSAGYNAHGMEMYAGGSERLTLRSSGNIGIGENNPSEKLVVKGNMLVKGTADDGPDFNLKNSANNTWSLDAYGPTNSRFRIVTGGGASGGVERMSILENGNVGIGHGSPAYKLYVNGTSAGTSAFQNVSDERYKKNIELIDSAIERIMKIDGVYFDWRNDEFPKLNFVEKRDMGVIAQNIEKVFPEAVLEDDNGYKSVAYSKLVAPLIEATKEQQREIKSLKKQNIQMKNFLCDKFPEANFCEE